MYKCKIPKESGKRQMLLHVSWASISSNLFWRWWTGYPPSFLSGLLQAICRQIVNVHVCVHLPVQNIENTPRSSKVLGTASKAAKFRQAKMARHPHKPSPATFTRANGALPSPNQPLEESAATGLALEEGGGGSEGLAEDAADASTLRNMSS